jgi:Protein of unknown function (DUF616)
MIVYTAIYGDYDRPKPTFKHPLIDEWRLYTDNENLNAPGWNIVKHVAIPGLNLSSRMQAKWQKCHLPMDNEKSLYIDGSITVNPKSGFIDIVDDQLEEFDFALYHNPERSTILEEAIFSEKLPKYSGMPLVKQATAYIENVPSLKEATLWAGGILARKRTVNIKLAGWFWFDECTKWSTQDQISLPYMLYKYEIRPVDLGNLYKNPYFTIDYAGHKNNL